MSALRHKSSSGIVSFYLKVLICKCLQCQSYSQLQAILIVLLPGMFAKCKGRLLSESAISHLLDYCLDNHDFIGAGTTPSPLKGTISAIHVLRAARALLSSGLQALAFTEEDAILQVGYFCLLDAMWIYTVLPLCASYVSAQDSAKSTLLHLGCSPLLAGIFC